MTDAKQWTDEDKLLIIETWNAAIEAAAKEMDDVNFQVSAIMIRKLKK